MRSEIRTRTGFALVVRPMVAGDIDEVAAIEQTAFASPWTRGMFLHEIDLTVSRAVVVQHPDTGAIVAYACWWVVAGEADLLDIAVHPDGRRDGIGRALMRAVLEDVAAQARVMRLEVSSRNDDARRMYESLGFRRSGLRRKYYGPDADALIMSLDLPG